MNLLYVTHHRRPKTRARSAPWAAELVRRGHEVTLICIAPRERWRLKESVEEGVRYVESPDLFFGALRSGWDPWGLWNRSRYLAGRTFDIVHCFETRPATIHPVLRWLRSRPIPLVIDWNDWWGRGGLIKERRPGWYRALFGGIETWYEEHFRPLADHTTAISTALARRAESLGIPADRVTVIRGGVDPAAFRERPPAAARPEFGLQEDRFVAFFASADAMMDLDLVLQAVQLASTRIPGLLLVMTGHRPSGLDARARSLGIDRQVRHLGFLPYERLPHALSCADVFLLPFSDTVANRGRWPHKVGEYMACGRPTVSNPVGDIRELFERERVGLLADPTPEAMAEAIVRLRDEAALRLQLGARARQVAETRFAWPRIADRVEGVYRRIVQEWRGGCRQ